MSRRQLIHRAGGGRSGDRDFGLASDWTAACTREGPRREAPHRHARVLRPALVVRLLGRLLVLRGSANAHDVCAVGPHFVADGGGGESGGLRTAVGGRRPARCRTRETPQSTWHISQGLPSMQGRGGSGRRDTTQAGGYVKTDGLVDLCVKVSEPGTKDRMMSRLSRSRRRRPSTWRSAGGDVQRLDRAVACSDIDDLSSSVGTSWTCCRSGAASRNEARWLSAMLLVIRSLIVSAACRMRGRGRRLPGRLSTWTTAHQFCHYSGGAVPRHGQRA